MLSQAFPEAALFYDHSKSFANSLMLLAVPIVPNVAMLRKASLWQQRFWLGLLKQSTVENGKIDLMDPYNYGIQN